MKEKLQHTVRIVPMAKKPGEEKECYQIILILKGRINSFIDNNSGFGYNLDKAQSVAFELRDAIVKG